MAKSYDSGSGNILKVRFSCLCGSRTNAGVVTAVRSLTLLGARVGEIGGLYTPLQRRKMPYSHQCPTLLLCLKIGVFCMIFKSAICVDCGYNIFTKRWDCAIISLQGMMKLLSLLFFVNAVLGATAQDDCEPIDVQGSLQGAPYKLSGTPHVMEDALANARASKRKAPESEDLSDSAPQAKKSKPQSDANTHPSSSSEGLIEKTLKISKIDASRHTQYSRRVDSFLSEEHQVAPDGNEEVKTTYEMLCDIVHCSEETGYNTFYSVVLDKVFHDIARFEGFAESAAVRWNWSVCRYDATALDLKDRVVIDLGGRYCISGREVKKTLYSSSRELQGYSLILTDLVQAVPGTPRYYWGYDASIALSSSKLKVMKLGQSGLAVYALGADSFLEERHRVASQGKEVTKTTEEMLRDTVLYAQQAGCDSFYSVVLDEIFRGIVRREGFPESTVTRWHWSINPCDAKVKNLKNRVVMHMAGLCCLTGRSFDVDNTLSSKIYELQGYHLILKDCNRDNPRCPLYYWAFDVSKQKPLH